MYGLVNQGVRDMVIEAGGEGLWQTVRDTAGIDLDEFSSMTPYDDSLTMALVNAASDVLETSAGDLLRGFGKHWIAFTHKTGYGPLMAVSGDSVREFLGNLDQMHARIKISMPDLDPPGFNCMTREDGVIEVSYYSSRFGLVPMVVGLIEGLADRFGETVSIEQTVAKEDVEDPDILEVTICEDG